jgi:hypothetical protein
LSDQFANSYVDVTYCDEYWGQHWSTDKADQWAALTTAQKTSLLIQACRSIESLRFTVNSVFTDADTEWRFDRSSGMVVELPTTNNPVRAQRLQSLQFPRTVDRNAETGAFFVPEPIKMAQCEQAVYLLNMDETAIANRLQGISQETVEVGTLRTSQNVSAGGVALAPMALEYVRPFLIRTSSSLRRG